MKLMDQLAVQDLVALADVLLMQEDDLALAVVLKSPLFGLDDDALFDLAYERKGSLWSALKDKSREDGRFAEAYPHLSAWLPPSRSPAALRVLLRAARRRAADDARAHADETRFEAAEAIDEFLDLALAYDREAAPSLQGFIGQLRGSDGIEMKRDIEQGRDEVRIMTVHGAKGLQGPIRVPAGHLP